MDSDNLRQHAEIREAEVCEVDRCQHAYGKEEAMNRENLPLLAAYGDETLSIEAANQLVQMAEDTSHPVYAGEDLPVADRTALLRKVASLQQSS
jgi:hypothetical protein